MNARSSALIRMVSEDHVTMQAGPDLNDMVQLPRGDQTVSRWAEQIAIEANDRGVESVLFCVPPSQTSLVRLDRSDVDDLTTGRMTTEMVRYAVEDVLPIDAESIELACLQQPDGAMVLVTEIQPSATLVDALEEHSVLVQRIVCDSLMIAQYLNDDDASQLLWIVDDDHDTMVDLVFVDDGVARQWTRFENDPDRITEEWLAIKAMYRSESFRHRRVGDKLRWEAASIDDAFAPTVDSTDRVRRSAALEILSNRVTPWFDLRRGRLAAADPLRRVAVSLRRGLLAIAVAILAITVAMNVRAWRQERLVERSQDQITRIFRETFPGVRVPAAVIRRIRSEHTRLIGQRGGVDRRDVAVPSSATAVLEAVLEAVPDSISLDIDELRVEDGRYVLDVQLEHAEDAAETAAALSAAGLSVAPPSTTRVRGGIQARFRGKLE
ncbi:MAG: type II secretion system protein GspL [Planctomycetota bacterium]